MSSYTESGWRFFIRQFPRQTFVMILFLALAGVAETIGAISIVPLLGSLFGDGGSASPIFVKIREAFLWVGMTPSLETVLIVLCGAMLVKSVLSMVATCQAGFIETEIATRLRIRMLDGLLKAQWSYFTSRPSGELIHAMSTEATQSGVALRFFCQTVSLGIQTLSYLAVGALVSWELLLVGIGGGGVFVLLFRKVIQVVRNAGTREVDALNKMTTSFTDVLAGAKPLKVMGIQNNVVRYIKQQIDVFHRAARQHIVGVGIMNSVQEPILLILLSVGIYATIKILGMDVASVLAMAFFFQRILSRFSSAQQSLQLYVGLEASLLSIVNKSNMIDDNRERGDAGAAASYAKEILLDDVSFSYGEKRILNSFSLKIPFGEITTIFGPSGVGKTTVADIVCGLVSPDSGRVLVDGNPLKEVDTHGWRQLIGYVPQEVFLSNDTIRNNLVLGRDYSDEDVWSSLERAGAAEFVRNASQGLDSLVGEHGRALSGGQRQRLMIARAVISNPRLLIFDEATSGLDVTTEAEILQNIRAMKSEMGVLIISHQSAAKGVADSVYEFNQATS